MLSDDMLEKLSVVSKFSNGAFFVFFCFLAWNVISNVSFLFLLRENCVSMRKSPGKQKCFEVFDNSVLLSDLAFGAIDA